MTLLVFGIFVSLSFSREIKKQQSLLEDCNMPSGYIGIPDDSVLLENSKLYACQQEFKKQMNIKNCVLTILSCTFTGITLSSKPFGIILINIENFPADLTGNIEVRGTTFNSCIGGCVCFTSNDGSKSINIADCSFKSCETDFSDPTSLINIKAASGTINNCQFINNRPFAYRSGCITFEQPSVGEKDLKLSITNCAFEQKEKYTNIFSIKNDNSKLELKNNQFKIDESSQNTCIFNEGLTQFQHWTLDNNCMKTLRTNLIFDKGQTDANKPIIEKFIECPAMECPPIPDPNSNQYVNDCDNTYEETSNNIKETLVTFFYCKFKGINNWDPGLGGAIYLSTSDKMQKDIKLPFKIYNCEFSTCFSTKGGAIAIESTEDSRPFEIKDCQFTGNECKKSYTDSYSDESFGGALFINAKSAKILISSSTFNANKAGNGGAIYYITDSPISSKLLEGETENDCSLKVTGCTFTQNEGYNDGGAIHISLLNGEPPKPIEISQCSFNLNRADEFDYNQDDYDILPESGGAIYFAYKPTSSSADFKFSVKSCKFTENTCSHDGGAICLLLIDKEPTIPIEINNCEFDKNKADDSSVDDDIEGYGADIFYSLDVSAAAPAPSKILLDSNPSLKVIDCDFSNGLASVKGGSLYFTVKDVQTSRPVEVTKCTFKEATSKKGQAINILSNKPEVLFHFSQCEFSGKFSIHFNAVSGHFDFCTFDNIVESYPIQYDCNPDVSSSSANPSFMIEHSAFVQNDEITSLVFFVPNDKSNFAFSHNSVNITNTVTRIFDCPSDAQKLGKWVFDNNTMSPKKEEFIKTENAQKIDFEASCENGFDCVPSFCSGDRRCYINGNDYGISLILIINTKFTGMEYDTNGGAVELINYGIICNTTEFRECKSKEAGGAIYIRVDAELNDPISFKNVNFILNEAVYGGALYIYSSIEKNVIEIFTCTFDQNIASKVKKEDEKYGGSAIYMTALNSKIVGCKFTKNTGNGVKFYTVFENSLLSIKDEFSSSISFDNCVFEMNEKSSSSIYYIHSNKKEVVVNLKDCLFKGNLAKNAHHIDGTSLEKKVDAPKIKIESCKFSSNKKLALNLNSNLVVFDTKLTKFNFNDSLKNEQEKVIGYNWKLISALVMTVVGVVVVIVVVVIKKHNNNNNNQEESNEETAEL